MMGRAEDGWREREREGGREREEGIAREGMDPSALEPFVLAFFSQYKSFVAEEFTS